MVGRKEGIPVVIMNIFRGRAEGPIDRNSEFGAE
jgi:hypothetical protein